jgi:DNA modification methylase
MTARQSAVIDTRVIYCGDCLDQLPKLPDACVDLIYIDPPFNSNRNYEVFWGEAKEKRSFEAVMTREDRKKGFFVAFDYSSDAMREMDGFFRRSGKSIVPFTVKEILEGGLAKRLA